MEYGATMKQINCIRYFGTLLQADSGHMCFGLEFSFNSDSVQMEPNPFGTLSLYTGSHANGSTETNSTQ